MRFTESPVINLQVLDKPLSFQQDNNSLHVGTSVWPCSLVLVKFLERWSSQNPQNPNPYSHLLSFSGKRAVDLGAGCGVAGIGLSVLGLHHTLLTDIAAVMPALKRNLKRNKPHLPKPLKTAQLYWNNKAQIEDVVRKNGGFFDFVVAADVVYIEDSVRSLVEAMAMLVGDDGVVLLGYQLRCPSADRLFWEVCEGVFSVEKVPKGDLHPDYAFEEADVFVMRKKVMRGGSTSSGDETDSPLLK
ncbi:hypothetical protein Scep_011435 [Stephania cephalantha]|uniref:Uncharacterized protein n=1 Tax=Stephania cephalantha TaxID=152367 RepID=A0AAP0JCZ9_9MAGN